MIYVTIQGWGPPSDSNRNYASQGVFLENGAILGPKAIAKVAEISDNLREILRQCTDNEVQEYLDAGREILDGMVGEVEREEVKSIRKSQASRRKAAAESAKSED